MTKYDFYLPTATAILYLNDFTESDYRVRPEFGCENLAQRDFSDPFGLISQIFARECGRSRPWASAHATATATAFLQVDLVVRNSKKTAQPEVMLTPAKDRWHTVKVVSTPVEAIEPR